MKKFTTALFILSIIHVGLFAQVNLNDGLVAYYPFDGNLLDASENTNHGNALNNVGFSTDRFGNANSAVRFSGTGSPGRVDVINNTTLQFTTAATFTCWMRLNFAFGTFGNGSTGNGGSQCPWTKNGDQGGGLWHLSTFSNNTLNNTYGNVGMPSTTAAVNNYTLGTWVHMTYVMAATETRIYYNGNLVTTWVGAPNFATMNNRNLSFGRFSSNWYPFNGDLDDFRIYNRAITTDEINALNTVTAPEVNISFTPSSFCAGSEVNINYTVSNGNIFVGNQYLVQLSDGSGSFANPTTIAAIPSTNLTGILQATIPSITSSGTAYKIRVQSTNVGALSNESQNITITGILITIPNPALYNYMGSFNGIHYYQSTTQLSWVQSVAQAAANGGHLAVVPNAQVNNFLQANNNGLSAYIGLTDEVTEGTFRWVDGTPLTYTNWSPGEPSNGGGGEDYAVMFTNGRWNDTPGGAHYSFFQLRPAGIPQTTCTGNTVNLSGAAIAGATYNWSGPNNFSSSLQNPTIENAGIINSGEYTLTHTLSGCSVSNATTVTVNQSPVNFGESSALLPTLNNGLLLHLPMNGNANDVSGNGYNGNIAGGVIAAADRFGTANQALQFTGSNGHIQLPAATYFNGTPFTVTVWANRATNANWNRCFDFGNGSANNSVLFAFTNENTGRAASEIYNGNVPTGQITAGASSATPLNQWLFLTYTWENGTGRIFANNNLVASGAQSAPIDIVRTLNYIGRSNWTQDAYFTGFMDDFRLYNRVLSATELSNLYMQQSSNMTVVASPLFLCASNPANVTLSNSQYGVSYRLRNSNTSTFVGNAQNGNGGNLVFNSGSINQTSAFEIVATTIGTNCVINLTPATTIQFGPATQPTIVADGAVSFCTGQNVVLTIPETSGANYQWKRNNNNVGTSSNAFTASEAGTYTVDVINTCGTVTSANSIVVVNLGITPTAPVISAAGPITVCIGQTVALSVVTQTGVTYQWKRNGSNIGINNNNFTANQSGTYTIELLSPCGNVVSSNSIAVTISGQAPTVPIIVATGNLTFCEGGSAALSIPNQTGVTYQWKRNNTNVGTNSNSFTASQSGTYTIEVSNSCGSIVSSNNVAITVNAVPAAPIITANGPLSFCEGQQLMLSLPTAQSYLWSNGAISQSISVNSSGTFSAQITQNGCISAVSQNTAVIVNAQPAAPTFSGNAPQICSGNSISLQVNSLAIVNWFASPIGGISIGTGTNFNSGILNTTITFYAEAAQGSCLSASRTAIAVDVLPSPLAEIQIVNPVTCNGDNDGSIVTNTTGASSFSWNNGATTPNLSNLSGGNYTLNAVASNGCSTNLSATVNEPSVIDVSANVVQISCFGQGQITISASGGTGLLTYSWAHGPTTAILNNLPEGAYSVNITDANNCSVIENYVISSYSELQATASVIPHSGFTPNGSITVNVAGGISPYTFDWLSGQNTSNISNLIAGIYFVTIVDSEGCLFNLEVEVPFINSLAELNGISWRFYPNPATEMVWIDWPEQIKTSVQLSIHDATGRLVMQKLNFSENQIDVSHFSPGLYLLTLQIGQERLNVKVDVRK